MLIALTTNFVIHLKSEKDRAVASERRALENEKQAKALLAELHAGTPAFYQQAKALMGEGHFDAALDRIAYAISLDPRNAAFPALNGDILESQFRFQEARDAYAKALSLDPKNPDTADNLKLCEKFIARFGGRRRWMH